MRVLVDTHAFFWWLTTAGKLSTTARSMLDDPSTEVLLSAVVAWELSAKGRLGKWPGGREVAADLAGIVAEGIVQPLAITIAHARLAGEMPGDHRDPFDRMLAAQARLEEVPLVTVDRAFRGFDIDIVW